jgi:hypothetical protein
MAVLVGNDVVSDGSVDVDVDSPTVVVAFGYHVVTKETPFIVTEIVLPTWEGRIIADVPRILVLVADLTSGIGYAVLSTVA